MSTPTHGTSRVKNGGLTSPLPPDQSESGASKRDLTSWWKSFKRGNVKKEEEKGTDSSPAPQGLPGIFGIPLQQSIRYANVAISLYDDDGKSYIYGYVPIVVAKCGVFLKEKATDIEGIFRLAGSERRIKELKTIFDSPDRYGKGLDWTGYTVHDASNILRRYINALPEPIIPLDVYERFRLPLRGHQSQAVGSSEQQIQSEGDFNFDDAIQAYKKLITELPPLNRQLLLYLLDLLAVFASKSELNKMTTANLAAIFQPGIITHPKDEMSPPEYRLSQDCLIFLIENQDNFLIGMQGTAADAKTVQEVQSGPPTPKPTQAPGVLGRSASNSSAGAENLRKHGGLRRNASASSKHSRNSTISNNGPSSPGFGGGGGSGSGGVYRSNTVPSKKSPAIQSSRFSREAKAAEPSTPPPAASPLARTATSPTPASKSEQAANEAPSQLNTATAGLAPPTVISPSSNESTPTVTSPPPATSKPSDPTAPGETPKLSIADMPPPPPAVDRSLEPERTGGDTPITPPGGTSTTSRSFTAMFGEMRSPQKDASKKDGRKPNKLQKKRAVSSANPSAHSSTHSLSHPSPGLPATQDQAPILQAIASVASPTEDEFSSAGPKDSNTNLKPAKSPAASVRSHPASEQHSDREVIEDNKGPAAAVPSSTSNAPASTEPAEEKKHRWTHLVHRHDKEHSDAAPQAGLTASNLSSQGADKSTTSVSTGRKSFTTERSTGAGNLAAATSGSSSTAVAGDDEGKDGEKKDKDKDKGPLGWVRGKLHDRKEREAEKRAKSPPAAGKTSDSPERRNMSVDAQTAQTTQTGAAMVGPGSAVPSVPAAAAATPVDESAAATAGGATTTNTTTSKPESSI